MLKKILLAALLATGCGSAATAQSSDSIWSPWGSGHAWQDSTATASQAATNPGVARVVECRSNDLRITTPGRKAKSIRPAAGSGCTVPGPYVRAQALTNSNSGVAAFGAVDVDNYFADPRTNGSTQFRYRAWQANGDSAILTSVVTVAIPKKVDCVGNPVTATAKGRKYGTVPPSAACEVPGPYVRTQILSNSNPTVAGFPSVDASQYAVDAKNNGTAVFRYQAWKQNGDSAILTSTVKVALPPVKIACSRQGYLDVDIMIERSIPLVPNGCSFPGTVTRVTWGTNTSRTTLSWSGKLLKGKARGPSNGGFGHYTLHDDINRTYMPVKVYVRERDEMCINISSGNSGYRWNYDLSNITWCSGS